ncbi:Rossmann-like fold-containing protein [Chryseobacterium taeanense]|uniref:Rossmann-like fold-containing protein n=1 Tax=Chryseobacterium taeanense TaxID=311334 RepID=UPI0035B05A01
MKTAKPVEVDNKAHKNPGKKQRPKDPAVMPFSESEAGNIHTQKSGDAIITSGLSNQDNSRLDLNGTIAAVHGSQNIYDQGSEVMYGRFQDGLKETGDINHPHTKDMEKGYIATLNVAQVQDYHNIKSGNYLPKTMQEQAEVHQESKKDQDVKALKPEPKTKPEKKSAVETKDKAEEQSTEAAPSPNAQNNPEFTQLSSKIAATAQSQKSHEPAKKASNDAQAAAPSPINERESMAQAGQVGYMDDQKPGTFSKAEFKALLKQKIEGIILPKDEASADDFENNNNIQQVNKNAVADVKNEKNAAINDIASATAAKPNVAAQPVRAIAKMPTPNIGKAPAIPNAGKAMPHKRDSASVEQPLKEQTNSIDSEMKAHGVTDQMLANSNEPSFTEALDEKNKAKKESAAATENFRKTEKTELSKTRDQAQSQAVHHIAGMHNARKGGLNHAHGEQKNTANKDSQKRKEIADHINSIYIDSKKDVDTILNKLDKKVAEMFEYGSKIAKKAFEDHVDKGMSAYKKKRYGDAYAKYGALATAGLWLWDKATGLPEEVNEYFVSGKALYIDTMDHYIDDIATHVTNQLNAAKTRIAKGKKDVQTYVNSLSPSLRKIGKEAIADIQNKFNALEESVNSKKDALIDVLAKKYAENVASIDARIEELKAQNSGFINKALNALSGVFAFIIEIKNTLTNLLAGIVDVVMAIIADPIGFFKNLIAGVGQGFANFGANIWTHLKTGFFTWLTGATKGIDLTMPEDIFSLKGIFSITTQVLGLTWNGIRAIGSRVVGEPVMKVLETGVEMVQIVRKEGAAGLWEHLKEQFADLKATIMDTIMDMIQTQVIQAGIKWVMGLLTPVGAFIKAAMAIIDVVKFFIQRAAQIMELIKAFIDSVAAIASGNVSAVAKSIENALGKAVPVLIGFLASLLGIGGLADKVLGVIRKIRQRIENAIVKFWTFVKGKAGKLLGKIGVGKNDRKVKDERSVEKKQEDLRSALAESHNLLKSGMTQSKIANKLQIIKKKYKLKELRIVLEEKVEKGIKAHVHGEVNPKNDTPSEILQVDDFTPNEGNKILLVGEANFSFSLSIAKALAIQGRMVATSYDSENTKYKDKDENIKEHKKLGTVIEYNIDATNTSYEPNSFEIIVFNFPWVKEETRGGTINNKKLLKDFFNEANRIIKKEGKILLSLSDERYVSRWKPEEQANGFVLSSKKLFDSKNFPGYEHKMTQKDKPAGSMEDGKGVTLIFKK